MYALPKDWIAGRISAPNGAHTVRRHYVFWLGNRMATDRFTGSFPQSDRVEFRHVLLGKSHPTSFSGPLAAKTVVSVTRPIYSGKEKL
jgi:hypothetical protein